MGELDKDITLKITQDISSQLEKFLNSSLDNLDVKFSTDKNNLSNAICITTTSIPHTINLDEILSQNTDTQKHKPLGTIDKISKFEFTVKFSTRNKQYQLLLNQNEFKQMISCIIREFHVPSYIELKIDYNENSNIIDFEVLLPNSQ